MLRGRGKCNVRYTLCHDDYNAYYISNVRYNINLVHVTYVLTHVVKTFKLVVLSLTNEYISVSMLNNSSKLT